MYTHVNARIHQTTHTKRTNITQHAHQHGKGSPRLVKPDNWYVIIALFAEKIRILRLRA